VSTRDEKYENAEGGKKKNKRMFISRGCGFSSAGVYILLKKRLTKSVPLLFHSSVGLQNGNKKLGRRDLSDTKLQSSPPTLIHSCLSFDDISQT